MNLLNTTFILAAAYLAVFWEAGFSSIRHLIGAQVDVLPALMIYASLSSDLVTVALLAFLGGLGLDALSANPLGVSVLPLFSIGLAIHVNRDLIVRDQAFAQWSLGLAASALAPVLTLVILLTSGHKPMLGWGSLWQWVVMAVGGGLATPVCFGLFGGVHRLLVHSGDVPSAFRPDREIRRGR